MTTRPPFDFDLRVTSDKKRKSRRRRGMSGAVEGADQRCAWRDCGAVAEYRAPKSPDQLDEYVWFCRDHIREYNLNWNFFQGQTEDEFARFIDKERVWGRTTRPLGARDDEGRAWTRLGVQDPLDILGDKGTRSGPSGATTRRLPPSERRALDILDARDSWTRAAIRKQYKSLVKDLHPDSNAGDRADEDRLQEVVWAWDQIKASRNFKD